MSFAAHLFTMALRSTPERNEWGCGMLNGAPAETLTYDSAHKHAVAAYESNIYTYDANDSQVERVLDGSGYTLVYDGENRLIEVYPPRRCPPPPRLPTKPPQRQLPRPPHQKGLPPKPRRPPPRWKGPLLRLPRQPRSWNTPRRKLLRSNSPRQTYPPPPPPSRGPSLRRRRQPPHPRPPKSPYPPQRRLKPRHRHLPTSRPPHPLPQRQVCPPNRRPCRLNMLIIYTMVTGT